MPDTDISSALAVAYRHYDDASTTEAERDAILEAMSVHLPDVEARTAAKALHHRIEARAHQLELKGLLNNRRPAA